MKVANRIKSSRPLATTAMHGRVEALKAQGQQVIDFSIAISHFPAPEPVRSAVADGIRQHALPYTSVTGAAPLRTRLMKKLKTENGIEASSDEVIVTNGAKQALYEALYVLTDPGDEVVVFRPYWPAYLATIELLGLRPVLVDLPDVLTPAILDALPNAKVLIINNPHNPTGKVFSAEELSHIKAWTARSGSYVIVDESYEKLIFNGRHISLASIGDWREPGIVTIFSASQSYAMMGWRVGFAVAPANVVAAMETLQGPITAAASALTQIAADAAFASGDPTEMMDDYRKRRDMVIDMFANVPWMRMQSPDSGPYLWGDVSSLTMDTVGFAESLLEQHKVAVMPGDALGVPGHIRLGYISDDVETLRQGVQAIIRFGNQLASQKTK